jgi:FtsH-binding integral membrane protein
MPSYATSSLYNLIYNKNLQKGGTINKNIFKPIFNNKKFLLLTFSNLILQLGITYYFMETYKEKLNTPQIIGAWITVFSLIIIISMVPMPMWLKFILFTIFSSLFGIILSSLKNEISEQLIQFAILGTISIYFTMFLIGVILILFGIQLSLWVGLLLFYLLLSLILFEIISIFLGNISQTHQIYGIIGVILFSFYIIYDTNYILQRNYFGDFITASMDYYLDILNVFISLINVYN